MESSKERPWNFQAGHLALDFANTVDWHESQNPEEHLKSYADLVNWSQDFGILENEEAQTLLAKALEQPEAADEAFMQAVSIRETVYRIFHANSMGESPNRDDLERLRATLAQAITAAKLIPEEKGFQWEWKFTPRSFEQMLWPIAQAAVDLLLSKDLSQVGQCADDRGCGLLFIDTSRNHSRQWCSMETCGNRAKAQRHYKRVRNVA